MHRKAFVKPSLSYLLCRRLCKDIEKQRSWFRVKPKTLPVVQITERHCNIFEPRIFNFAFGLKISMKACICFVRICLKTPRVFPAESYPTSCSQLQMLTRYLKSRFGAHNFSTDVYRKGLCKVLSTTKRYIYIYIYMYTWTPSKDVHLNGLTSRVICLQYLACL